MPELPEVETVKRIIEPQIVGKRITDVRIGNAQVIACPEPGKFAECLRKQEIASMSRRGKFLTVHFEGGDRLVLHLRMTGKLLVMPAEESEEKHTHLILSLSDGSQIRYIDVRRFGRFWFFQKDEADTLTGQDKLGPEPTDACLTAEYLKSALGNRKKPVKEMLHDQRVVAGIGNIYSDEILFASGIYPEMRCSALKDADWKRLAEKIPEIIRWGIDMNQMTPKEYLEGKGREYRNTPHLRIYGRSGQPCVQCRSAIQKITVGGRSSCYCPVCQEECKPDSRDVPCRTV